MLRKVWLHFDVVGQVDDCGVGSGRESVGCGVSGGRESVLDPCEWWSVYDHEREEQGEGGGGRGCVYVH